MPYLGLHLPVTATLALRPQLSPSCPRCTCRRHHDGRADSSVEWLAVSAVSTRGRVRSARRGRHEDGCRAGSVLHQRKAKELSDAASEYTHRATVARTQTPTLSFSCDSTMCMYYTLVTRTSSASKTYNLHYTASFHLTSLCKFNSKTYHKHQNVSQAFEKESIQQWLRTLEAM